MSHHDWCNERQIYIHETIVTTQNISSLYTHILRHLLMKLTVPSTLSNFLVIVLHSQLISKRICKISLFD